jgi:hypothetical protein
MLRIDERKLSLGELVPSRPQLAEVWHLSTAIVPRRSISGRLLWGTVMRRRDGRKWIYKQFTRSAEAAEYLNATHALIKASKSALVRRQPR